MTRLSPGAAHGCAVLLVLSLSTAATAQAGTQWTNIGPGIIGSGMAAAQRLTTNGLGNTIVAFGGSTTGTTSIFDGTSWVAGSTPSGLTARAFHAMASIGTSVVLFGGFYAGAPLGDTWLFDGLNWTNPTNTGPQPRYDHAMAPYNGGVLLFGGIGAGGVSLGDTWFFNGSSWTLLSLTGPIPRYAPAMAPLPDLTGTSSDQVVLFGGVGLVGGFATTLNDTHVFQNNLWSAVTTTSQPSNGFGNFRLPIAYDSYRHRVVLMDFLGQATGNTWEWIGNDWALRPAWGPPGGASSTGPRAFLQLPRTATNPGQMILVSNNSTYAYAPVTPGRFVTGGSSIGPLVQLDPAFQDVLWKGEDATIRATGFVPGGTTPQLVISAAMYVPPINLGAFGAPGYFLYADPNQGVTVPTTFTPATGTATITLNVPSSTALLSQLYFQFYQGVPNVNALHAVFTDYATGTVGLK